jgi:hypothetical protein
MKVEEVSSKAVFSGKMKQMSQFQKSVTFEIGFVFALVSLKPYANAAIKGCSFKNRPTFERASDYRII